MAIHVFLGLLGGRAQRPCRLSHPLAASAGRGRAEEGPVSALDSGRGSTDVPSTGSRMTTMRNLQMHHPRLTMSWTADPSIARFSIILDTIDPMIFIPILDLFHTIIRTVFLFTTLQHVL